MSIESRLEEFVRSLLGEDETSTDAYGGSGAGPNRYRPGSRNRPEPWASTSTHHDPDYAAALADLEYYLRTGTDRPDAATQRSREPLRNHGRAATKTVIPTTVVRAFNALEVTPGTDFALVTRAYKRLLAQFHPDKHASGPKRAAAANEVTKRLNLAYRVVRDYYLVTGKITP